LITFPLNFAVFLRRLRGSSELDEVSSFRTIHPGLFKGTASNLDVHAGQLPAERVNSSCVGKVQESLQMGGACARSPLVAIAYVTWLHLIEDILVLIGIVVPGEDERSVSGGHLFSFFML